MWKPILACLLAAALYGCGPSKALKQDKPKSEPEKAIQAEASAKGISVLWSEKTENGGIRKVIEAKAQEGTINAEKKSSEMKKATGTLYKENKPAARLQADVIRGDENKHVVVATGSVKVTSINPPGYTMTTKKATWNAAKDLITAEGEVYLTYQKPGESAPSITVGPSPRAQFQTELKVWKIWNE